jgi:hypothetical protein
MDRGISPTVREGSDGGHGIAEPSLTVGLMPRPGHHNFRTTVNEDQRRLSEGTLVSAPNKVQLDSP